MKFSSTLSVVCIVLILGGTACKKELPAGNKKVPGITLNSGEATRKVRFLLYTDQDFSTDNHNMFFTVSIKDANNRLLWDSALAPMKVKDIPALANKISIEKQLPGNDMQELHLAFDYYMENVGYSWHLGIVNAGETTATLDYNFR